MTTGLRRVAPVPAKSRPLHNVNRCRSALAPLRAAANHQDHLSPDSSACSPVRFIVFALIRGALVSAGRAFSPPAPSLAATWPSNCLALYGTGAHWLMVAVALGQPTTRVFTGRKLAPPERHPVPRENFRRPDLWRPGPPVRVNLSRLLCNQMPAPRTSRSSPLRRRRRPRLVRLAQVLPLGPRASVARRLPLGLIVIKPRSGWSNAYQVARASLHFNLQEPGVANLIGDLSLAHNISSNVRPISTDETPLALSARLLSL